MSTLPPSVLAICFMLAYCLAYPSTLNMEATCSSETSVGFQGLQCFISHKLEIFIATGVRISCPRCETVYYVTILNE
jgi:hypothetical protein